MNKHDEILDSYEIVEVMDSKVIVLAKAITNILIIFVGVPFWILGFLSKLVAGAFMCGCDAFDNFFDNWLDKNKGE